MRTPNHPARPEPNPRGALYHARYRRRWHLILGSAAAVLILAVNAAGQLHLFPLPWWARVALAVALVADGWWLRRVYTWRGYVPAGWTIGRGGSGTGRAAR